MYLRHENLLVLIIQSNIMEIMIKFLSEPKLFWSEIIQPKLERRYSKTKWFHTL